MRRTPVLAAASVVAVAAGGLATQAIGSDGGPSAHASKTLKLSSPKSGALKFNVKKLSVKHGKVTLRFSNPSRVPHAIAVEGKGVDKDGKTVTKGTSTVTARLKKGKYTFYCPVDGHRAAGMKGTLTVK